MADATHGQVRLLRSPRYELKIIDGFPMLCCKRCGLAAYSDGTENHVNGCIHQRRSHG